MRFSEEQLWKPCGCRSVGECSHNSLNWKRALDACVDAFADELKKKLVRKYLEGKSGWDDPSWPREDIIQQLRAHIDKGDMVDVAAFAMFAWNQDDAIREPRASTTNEADGLVTKEGEKNEG